MYRSIRKEEMPMGKRGRPRSFDRAEALERAMRVFWERGYEGASVAFLTQAMGITPPSLYAAFGSKEELFREALALYDATEGAPMSRALTEAPTARAAVEAILRANVDLCSDPANPGGCMMVLSATAGAPALGPVRAQLTENRCASEQALRRRLEQAVTAGELATETDTAAVAAFYATVVHGLSIQALDGASCEELTRIVDAAMAAWEVLAPPGPLEGDGAPEPGT
jgi:AcrR family transcriptional regulator